MKREEFKESIPEPNPKKDLGLIRKILIWVGMFIVGVLAISVSIIDWLGYITLSNDFYKVAPLIAVGLSIMLHALSKMASIERLFYIEGRIYESETRILLFLKKVLYGFEDESED